MNLNELVYAVLLNAMLRRTGEKKFFFSLEELNTEQAVSIVETADGLHLELITQEQAALHQQASGRLQ